MRTFFSIGSLLLFLICSGCGTIHRTAAISETGVPVLDSLNQVLKGHEAALTLISGDEKPVQNIRLDVEETRYEVRPAGRIRHIPTDEIARITIIEETGGKKNLVGLVLAVPGLVIMGISGVELIAGEQGSYARGFAPLFLLAGAGIAAAGAILGSIIGSLLLPKKQTQEILVYEGPVSRYLEDEMPP